MTPDRRHFLAGAGALAASACVPIDTTLPGRLTAKLRIIEAASGGTLGVSFYNTGSGASMGLNRTMRFGHCSSFKFSLAAMVLYLDQQGVIDARQQVQWTAQDLLANSIFTQSRLDQGASLLQLAEAAQKYSDNTASNILLEKLGGPERLTQFWRDTGDTTSRIDRLEPEVNHVPPGEERDTTTPDAMARTVARLSFDPILGDDQRDLLRNWMLYTATGENRVRAGVPDTWLAGDKTGTSLWPGMGALYVDIGWVRPPQQSPVSFATYFRAATEQQNVTPKSEAVLAEVGKVLADFALNGAV